MWRDDCGGDERPRVIGVWSDVARRAVRQTRLPAALQQGQGCRMDHCLCVGVRVYESGCVVQRVLWDFFKYLSGST